MKKSTIKAAAKWGDKLTAALDALSQIQENDMANKLGDAMVCIEEAIQALRDIENGAP